MNKILFCHFCWCKYKTKFPLKSEGSLLNTHCERCPAEIVMEEDKDGKPTGKKYLVEDPKKYCEDPNSVEKIPIEECF